MGRPVTLFTGQWADLPLAVLAEKAAGFGYDGLELACWGDHMDVFKAAEDPAYCEQQKAILEKHNLQLFAISNHLAGQLVCDLTSRDGPPPNRLALASQMSRWSTRRRR